jgi:hypothetical protein
VNNVEEREEAIKHLLAGAGNIRSQEDVSIGLDLLGWIVHPVRYQSQIVGAILEKEGELHTSIAPDFQKLWNPRPYIKSILYPALDKYGKIYSDARKDDPNGQQWLLKLGFEYLRTDKENFFFVLNKKKFR